MCIVRGCVLCSILSMFKLKEICTAYSTKLINITICVNISARVVSDKFSLATVFLKQWRRTAPIIHATPQGRQTTSSAFIVLLREPEQQNLQTGSFKCTTDLIVSYN